MFSMDPETYRELSQPSPRSGGKPSDGKLRKLYLQAASQQWFAPERVDFSKPVAIDPRLREAWLTFGTIFYTLEKMGLGVLDHMIGKAADTLGSDDAAFYLTTQCADEARHVFLIESYLRRLGRPPRYEKRYLVLGKVASTGFYRVENWLFSTLFSENFASAFLRRARGAEIDDFGREMCTRILSDEHRHLHFLHIVLPEVVEGLSLLGRSYVKASQYFIMTFAERVTRSLEATGADIGIQRRDLLEEVFENVRKAYDGFGVGRDFLRFPAIGAARCD
jgi:hypothetical protein